VGLHGLSAKGPDAWFMLGFMPPRYMSSTLPPGLLLLIFVRADAELADRSLAGSTPLGLSHLTSGLYGPWPAPCEGQRY
jgi:hypothetical protein